MIESLKHNTVVKRFATFCADGEKIINKGSSDPDMCVDTAGIVPCIVVQSNGGLIYYPISNCYWIMA